MICFGDYTLDPVQGLRRGADEIRLTPKSLSLLLALAGRAGEIVLKEELFHTVWHDTAVSDSALTSCIQEVRNALKDDARRPRYVETVHRRGYRFIAAAARRHTRELQAPQRPAPAAPSPIVGRDDVVDALVHAFRRAEAGHRQVWFVSGAAGLGKSTVVQAALDRIGHAVRVAAAQCIEQYGKGEPYQPLLDALMRLCRQPGGDRFIAHLERYAPTWLVQLSGLLEPDKQATLLRTVSGTTRDRMLREFTNALEVMTADLPLVITLEDLHWCDTSTLDWLAAFAQRPEPARLLILGTFRPSGGEDHPIGAISDVLHTRGACSIVPLAPLGEEAVVEYVLRRFSIARNREGLTRLARRVHAHAGGHPLFVVNILADLIGRRVLSDEEGWTIDDEIDRVDLGVSDDLRRTIERQVGRLEAAHRDLLDVASVAGTAFSSAVVAGAMESDQAEVESSLNALARRRQFIHEEELAEWPDGTLSTGFAFDHAVYREVLYRRLAAGRRADLHRRIAECQERAYGERAPQIAAELAMHFDHARQPAKAVRYLQHAAQNARARHAYSEARAHFDRALTLLETLPPSAERTEQEVTARIGIGAAIMATRGFGSAEAEAAYSRARVLCHAAGDTPRLFPSLWGLWLFYWGRGAVTTAAELAHDLAARAAASGDADLQLQALHASWATAFSQGDFEATCTAAAEGIRLYDVHRHAGMAATYGSHDAGVCARMFSARALALLGREDEALRLGDEAIVLAESLDHPFSTALALTFRAAVDQSHGDAAAAQRHAGRAAAIAREQEFRLMLAWCSAIHGWASLDSDGRALAGITGAIAAARESGSDQFLPYLLGTHADACLQLQRAPEGLQSIADALEIVVRTGERFYEAELYRLRGELLFVYTGDAAQAESSISKAVVVAERQHAGLLVRRATSSLQRLRRRRSAGAR